MFTYNFLFILNATFFFSDSDRNFSLQSFVTRIGYANYDMDLIFQSIRSYAIKTLPQKKYMNDSNKRKFKFLYALYMNMGRMMFKFESLLNHFNIYLVQLSQLITHIRTKGLLRHYTTSSKARFIREECSVGLTSYGEEGEDQPIRRSVPCGHEFCLQCLTKYVVDDRKNTCPICRQRWLQNPVKWEKIDDLFKEFGEFGERRTYTSYFISTDLRPEFYSIMDFTITIV